MELQAAGPLLRRQAPSPCSSRAASSLAAGPAFVRPARGWNRHRELASVVRCKDPQTAERSQGLPSAPSLRHDDSHASVTGRHQVGAACKCPPERA